MIPPTYRAWRFVHPDLDRVEAAPGLQISQQGAIEMVTEHESIRQAVLLLLSTVPGERVLRPAYGCELHRLVFSPNDDTTAGLAIHYVRQAIRLWEPRIEVIRLTASRSEDADGILVIELEYRARITLQTDRVRFPIHLSGEAVR